jgi:hypothetical protein
MKYLKEILIILGFSFISFILNAQLTGISGGLNFSSGIDYNTGTTGNPGIFGKAYFKINKRFHVASSIAAFNKYKRSDFFEVLKTYMFQADIDGIVGLYKDKSLQFVGFAGLNTTAIVSKWDILEVTASTPNLINKSDIKPGLNLGGAFQLYVNDTFDAYVSAKYIVSSFDQVVINAGVIYYVGGKRRKGSW